MKRLIFLIKTSDQWRMAAITLAVIGIGSALAAINGGMSWADWFLVGMFSGAILAALVAHFRLVEGTDSESKPKD